MTPYLTPDEVAGVLRRAGFPKARHLGPWSTGGFVTHPYFGRHRGVFVAWDPRELPGRPMQDPSLQPSFHARYAQHLSAAGWEVEAIPHLGGLVVTRAESHAWDTAPRKYEL